MDYYIRTEILTSLVALFCVSIVCVNGFARFRDVVPNGHKVPHPCNPTSDVWTAVGHLNSQGRGERNPFGLDFYSAGNVWTKDLCLKDSDGDGRHNGLELGDPWCQWSTTNNSPLQLATTHPGICDPLESPKCVGKNKWLECPSFSRKCQHAIQEPGVLTLKVQFPPLNVPLADHSYVCMEYDLPSDKDYHMTAGLPIIDNRDVLGGVFVYACDAKSTAPASKHPYECGIKPRGDCRSFLGGYSSQIPGMCFHKNTGFRIGQTGCKKVLIQVRWDNRDRLEQMIDGSGMTLYYTGNMRRYDAATKLLSLTHFTIPAQRSIYAVSTVYPSECSLMQITSPIYITRAFNHMQHHGKQERVEVLRDGRVVNLLTDERFYDVHNPKTYWHTSPVQVLPGDILRITCVYSAKDAKIPIQWGHLSTNEICGSTIEYYPQQSWTASTCASFRSIPLCQLETSGIAQGCNFKKLFETLNQDSSTFDTLRNCSTSNICNPNCKALSRAAQSHPCLKGDCEKLLKSPVTAYNPRLETFFNVLKLCGHNEDVILQQRLND